MKTPIIFRVYKNNQIFFVKQFVDKDQLVFGSSQDSGSEVDVDFNSQEISPIHCLVEKRGPQFYLCDLGSAQGTFKNGQPVLDEPLSSGDEFHIGPFKVVFFAGAPKTAQSQEEVVAPVVAATAPVVSASPSVPVEEKPVVAPQVTSSTPPAPKIDQVKPQEKVVTQPVAPVIKSPEIKKTEPVVTAPPKATSVVPPQNKPKIASVFVGQRNLQRGASQFAKNKSKGAKTYAPASSHDSLSDIIKPGQGSVVEVVVSWKERVLTTYHFEPKGAHKAGPKEFIQLPVGAVPSNFVLVEGQSGDVTVRFSPDMKVELHKSDKVLSIKEGSHRLQQNEVVFVTLLNGMTLAIRFSPKTAVIPLDSPLILSSSEFTGILASLIFAVFLSLIVAVLTPKVSKEEEEEVQRVAQVIFDKPPVEVKPPPPPPPPQTPPQNVEEKVQQKPPEPKKVVVADKAKEAQSKGDPNKPKAQSQAAEKAGRASEVKPKDSKLKTKMFTSTKQGGAIKTGNVAGANAKSKDPDPTNAGLLSAFGSGGARSALDKAYSGSGEALGVGEKATGSSGFNEDRAGNDLGSKFKDTGAGGKGTATVGIAGVGTKGLGSGMGTGNGSGLGAKDQVAIQAGGAEEEFVGSIDREAVRRAIRSNKNAFQACFNREYNKNSSLEGKVIVVFEIHEKGIAKNARIDKSKSTISNAAVEECVRLRMLAIRFPEPPTGSFAEIVFPFAFKGQE